MYSLLEKNGLLKKEVNYWPQFALVMLSSMLALGLIMYIRQSEGVSRFKYNNSQFVMLLMIIVITIISMHLAAILQNESYNFV